MGLRNLFSRKKHKNDQVETTQYESVSWEKGKEGKRSVRVGSQNDRIGYIKDNCELIVESNRQMEEAKVEYQAVTSYLTDMQRIDMIPAEQKLIIEDAARKIINLSIERSKFQKKDSKLTDRHYRLFEQYEIQIPKDLPVIKESEKYQVVITQDINHLDKERKSLTEEKDEIINKQSFLKGIAITTCVVVVLLFLVFAVLTNYTDSRFTIPFLLTVLMGMASALYIFMEARKNKYDIQIVQMKLSREVMLMNKVKIKSVNNRNYLDYIYNKYMVDNYEQLKLIWEEYVRVKDEARRYQSNTELLEFYNNELIHTLKKFGIVDSDIWIYQPSAILDSKEMVEVRHRLNVRRQKLRERIDLNAKQKEDAMSAIQSIMKLSPELFEEAERMMKRYKIQKTT
ncbi:MAG: putative rane protein [Herbinix sp.]|nr:putative rane protein [Herbinix sp.]